MKTDDAYSATTIDGLEVFVHKKWDGTYKELRTKIIYKNTDLINMISLSKIIDVSTNLSIPAMIQMFHSSKYCEYYFHSLYIADIAIKKGDETEILEKNRLFYKKEHEYIDLFDYEKYTNNSDKIIINKKLFIEYLDCELVGKKQPRNKILTLYHKQFKNVV